MQEAVPDELPGEETQDEISYRSPLWMVTQQPALNGLVSYLEKSREKILSNPQGPHELVFSQREIREVKASFAEMIRHGEEKLHRLCELLCHAFLTQVHLHSVVIGEVPSTHERFTLTQNITREDLYSTIDLDLGNRQLKKLKFFDGKDWTAASLVANVVEYQALETNSLNIHKVVSRIKAEEEIWNKVVDEIFNLDSLVRRDKKFWHLSRYVKDVFGLKIVTGSGPDVQRVQQALELVRWNLEDLGKFNVAAEEGAQALEFIEIKNYLGQGERKKSGWEALKSVVKWSDKVFEIQVQPLGKFMREREFLTRESHSGFKSRREEIRNQVAEQIPLFRYFRDLLRWLFLDAHGAPPEFSGVRIVLKE